MRGGKGGAGFQISQDAPATVGRHSAQRREIRIFLSDRPSVTEPDDIGAFSAADWRLLETLLVAAPVEELERLARQHFSPSALRRRRLADRDALIRQLAAEVLARGGAA